MHIPFYTALKWWAPGSLPTYLNQTLPKEARERKRAEGGDQSGGQWKQAEEMGKEQAALLPVPPATPCAHPGQGGCGDAQVQCTCTLVAAAVLAYCCPSREVCHNLVLAFTKGIYTL